MGELALENPHRPVQGPSPVIRRRGRPGTGGEGESKGDGERAGRGAGGGKGNPRT